jgi:hypothetical protein
LVFRRRRVRLGRSTSLDLPLAVAALGDRRHPRLSLSQG